MARAAGPWNDAFWTRCSVAAPGGVRLEQRTPCCGSLALASLNLTYRNLVPTFPQRSPPLLLTTAACGGLRSTPDLPAKDLPSSLVQLRIAVWTGATRDTRPNSEVGVSVGDCETVK